MIEARQGGAESRGPSFGVCPADGERAFATLLVPKPPPRMGRPAPGME